MKTPIFVSLITVKQTRELLKQIRPVVRHGDKLWFAYVAAPMTDVFPDQAIKMNNADELRELCLITTYHKFATKDCFSATAVQILSQIPLGLIAKTSAFELVTFPRNYDDLLAQVDTFTQGYHRATVRLYTSEPA